MAIKRNIRLDGFDAIFNNEKVLTTLKYLLPLLNQQLSKFFSQLPLIDSFIFINIMLLQFSSTRNSRKRFILNSQKIIFTAILAKFSCFGKAFYSLKQFVWLLFNIFVKKIRELVFFYSHYDYALYLDYKSTYIIVYINNLQIIGPNLDLINCLKSNLASRFKMTDFGSTSHFFGIKVMQNDSTITIT